MTNERPNPAWKWARLFNAERTAKPDADPRDIARSLANRYPGLATDTLDVVGSWPSSAIEFRALQAVWR